MSEWHNFLWDLDKSVSCFGLNPAVPLCDHSSGQAHLRLKVNTGANQISSQKHSSSTSHCAIPTQAYRRNPHPSSDGGHDPMYQYPERNEGEYVWPFEAIADHYPFREHKHESPGTQLGVYTRMTVFCYIVLQVCNLFISFWGKTLSFWLLDEKIHINMRYGMELLVKLA